MASLVSAADLKLFSNIKGVMEQMPEVDLGIDESGDEVPVSCHMVTRALAKIFPGKVRSQDGDFVRRGQLHSWLVIGGGLVIDPYPIGTVGGPILVDCSFSLSPWTKLYIKRRLGIVNKDFQRHVRLVARAMRSVL